MAGRPENQNNPQGNRGPGAPRGGGNLYWIYALILLFIIFATYFFPSGADTRSTTPNVFRNELVPNGLVDSVVVVNKEDFEIYLTEEALEQPKYREMFPKDSPSARGPHFSFSAGASAESLHDYCLEHNITVMPVDKPGLFRYHPAIPFADRRFLWRFGFSSCVGSVVEVLADRSLTSGSQRLLCMTRRIRLKLHLTM